MTQCVCIVHDTCSFYTLFIDPGFSHKTLSVPTEETHRGDEQGTQLSQELHGDPAVISGHIHGAVHGGGSGDDPGPTNPLQRASGKGRVYHSGLRHRLVPYVGGREGAQ